MLKTMTVKKEAMQKAAATGFLNATELADFLAENDIPFRQAHQIVGEAVLFASKREKELDQLNQAEWEEILGAYLNVDAEKLKEKLSVEAAVNSHSTKGGPAFEESRRVIKKEKYFLLQK
jgi:argininosuccinate lyase